MLAEGERAVPMRLQRFLARAGVASRRGSEALMTAGRVRVNGRVVTELGSKVDPASDVVEVDGRVCRIEDAPAFLMLNKPAGYLTTMRDPHGRPCVASLVPTDLHPGLVTLGRLDLDTTGILLVPTDGDAGQRPEGLTGGTGRVHPAGGGPRTLAVDVQEGVHGTVDGSDAVEVQLGELDTGDGALGECLRHLRSGHRRAAGLGVAHLAE